MTEEQPSPRYDLAAAGPTDRLFDSPVVDTETHVFVRCWPIETSPQVSEVEPVTRTDHPGSLLVAEMDRVGVEAAILIGYDGYDFADFMQRFGSAPADFMGGRGYTRAWSERYPTRLKYVTTLNDPRSPAALESLASELTRGAIGVKIFPAYLKLQADAQEIRAVFDLLQERSAAAVFGFEDTEPPRTPSLIEFYEGIDRLAGDYPGVQIQLNHGANADPFGEDGRVLFEIVNSHDTILVSTSVLGGPGMEWPDRWLYPFPSYLRRLEAFSAGLSSDRIAWGTDWPWFEGVLKYPQHLQTIVDNATFFSDDEKRMYLGGNALRHWRLAGSEP